jgi:hypothetical protein
MTVRFAQESLSVFSRNWCPLSARTAVRFHQEYASEDIFFFDAIYLIVKDFVMEGSFVAFGISVGLRELQMCLTSK